MKGKKKGPWTLLSSTVAYRAPSFVVHADEVLSRTGKRITYSWIEMQEGVNIIPIDEKGNVYLAKEYRYGLGRECVEGVSGGIEKGDTPLASAKKELKEELGITAKKWTALGAYDSVTSKMRHREHLYLAEGLTFGAQDLEEMEEIGMVKMPFSRAVKLARSGGITYGFTALGLHLAEVLMKAHTKKK